MKRSALMALCLALIATPLAAADFDLTGWVSWIEPTGSDDPPFIEFDREVGFGLGFSVFWSDRFATEFAVYSVQPDIITIRGTDTAQVLINTIGINVVPFTAIAQYHFTRGERWDYYIGAGAAYVLLDDIDNPDDLDNLSLSALEFDNDFGFALNAGLSWNFTERWGINADVKYIPTESEAEVTPADGQTDISNVNFSPLIVSAGVKLRF